MRYLIGFVFVLALMASPLSVSAQAEEEGATSEPNLQEPAPPSEAVTEEPALEVPDIDTLSQRAIEHHETRSAQRTQTPDQQRARCGLIASSVIVAAGAAVTGGAVAVARNTDDLSETGPAIGLFFFGGALMGAGIIGIGISGKRLNTAKRKQREMRGEEHYGSPRRVQWDLAQSRLVF